jgi:hypothetical protein
MALSTVKQNGCAATQPPTMLEICHSITRRFQRCIGAGGGRFEHLLV